MGNQHLCVIFLGKWENSQQIMQMNKLWNVSFRWKFHRTIGQCFLNAAFPAFFIYNFFIFHIT